MRVMKRGLILVINDKLRDHYVNDLGYTEVKEPKPKEKSNDVPSYNNDLQQH